MVTGGEEDGGAASVDDGSVAPAISRAWGEWQTTPRGTASWRGAVRLTRASLDGGEARTSAAAAPVRSGRRRCARNTAGNTERVAQEMRTRAALKRSESGASGKVSL